VLFAHGLLAPKEDLPIPEEAFAWAAATVLVLSFIGLSVSWLEPRFESWKWSPAAAFSRIAINPATEILAGAIGIFLLGVVVWSGFYGTANSAANFNVTFVFVTFWVCVAIVSIFLGDAFRAFNPWRAIARVIGAVFNLVAGRSAPAPLSYPDRLGRWPAVAGLVAFLWFELAYGVDIGQSVILISPESIAVATLIYTAVTFLGMTLFGVEKWCERGETFSVYFNMLSRISPLEVRERQLGRRPWFAGAVGWGLVPGSVAFVLLAIAGTTFDGASEGVFADWIDDVYSFINGGGGAEGDVFARRAASSLFMVLTFGLVLGVFWAGIKGMGTRGSKLTTTNLARTFAHCFIPIAFAYTLAHYFSLVVFQEQAQFTYLLSDPLGNGSDYFGTASGTVDLRAITSEEVWYVQVGSLVIGHIAALAMGHDKALAVYHNLRRATQSQYWMLALMVTFTVVGLLLLSAANE